MIDAQQKLSETILAIQYLEEAGMDVPPEAFEIRELAELAVKAQSAERYRLVSDNDGHDYVIPVSRESEWDDFCEIPSDDERSWDVPEWAERVNGPLTFTDPRC